MDFIAEGLGLSSGIVRTLWSVSSLVLVGGIVFVSVAGFQYLFPDEYPGIIHPTLYAFVLVMFYRAILGMFFEAWRERFLCKPFRAGEFEGPREVAIAYWMVYGATFLFVVFACVSLVAMEMSKHFVIFPENPWFLLPCLIGLVILLAESFPPNLDALQKKYQEEIEGAEPGD